MKDLRATRTRRLVRVTAQDSIPASLEPRCLCSIRAWPGEHLSARSVLLLLCPHARLLLLLSCCPSTRVDIEVRRNTYSQLECQSPPSRRRQPHAASAYPVPLYRTQPGHLYEAVSCLMRQNTSSMAISGQHTVPCEGRYTR